MMRLGVAVLFAAIVAAPATAQLTWFTNEASFVAANAGNVLKGVEDYEASTAGPNSVFNLADPLAFGLPNGPNYPVGTQGLSNLSTQSNLRGGSPGVPNPRGAAGMAGASAGFLGAVSDVVIASTFVDSLDQIFSEGKVAVGGDTLSFLGAGSVDIRVYDTANNFLGQMGFSADPTGAGFAGVISSAPIGRVNVFDTGGGAEGLDNVQAWVPEPASLSLFVLGALALLRRRG